MKINRPEKRSAINAALLAKVGAFAGIIEARRTMRWIVAVDTPADDGGLEICLACDVLLASGG